MNLSTIQTMNRITLITLGLLAMIPTGHLVAQGFTEPTLTLYGRVRQVGSGAEHVLQSGELSLTLTNANLPGNSITRTVPLQPVGSGPIKLFSYAMSVPLKYNIAEYELAEFIEVEGAGAQIQLGDIMVDGEPAHLASVTDALLSFTQTDRADERRVDIVVDTPATDSDGDGVPDWWEEENGFNALYAGDADLDADGDGLSNREEFGFGTNPNDTDGAGNRAPSLLTQQVTITRDGICGLALRIVDSDTPPDQIAIVPLVIPSGIEIHRDGAPLPPGPITLSEMNAGRITLVDDGTSTSGVLQLQFFDSVHPAVSAGLMVDVFEPSVAGGVVANLWLDAQELSQGDGDPVPVWEDRAGNLDSMLDPRAFIQPDTSAQPSFELVGGKPAVAFDGAGEYLAGADASLPVSTRALFVYYHPQPNQTAQQTFLQSNGMAYQLSPFDGPVGYPGAATFTVGSQSIEGYQTSVDGAFLTAYRLSDEQGFAISNGLFNGTSAANPEPLEPVIPAIGARARVDLANPTQALVETPFAGKLHEILAYERLLGDPFSSQVEMYLLSRWEDAVIWNYREELVGLDITATTPARDLMQGGHGADSIDGGEMADVIYGGGGANILTGGPGADLFCYRSGDTGDDTITDFTIVGADHDVLDLSGRFLGRAGDLNDFITIEPRVDIVAGNVVLQTILRLDLDGDGGNPDQVLTLQGVALSTADLGWLLGEGFLLAGDLRLATELELSALTLSIREGQAQVGESIPITLQRSGNVNKAQEVPLSLGGTATPLLDFTLTGTGGTTTRPTVAFARNQTSATIEVVPVTDPSTEGDETVEMDIIPRERDYEVASAGAAITIEEATYVTISSSTTAIAREGGESGILTVSRTGPVSAPLPVILATGGDAVAGIDYTQLPLTVIIPAGAPTTVVPIIPVDSSSLDSARLDVQVVQSPGNYVPAAPWTVSVLFIPGTSVAESNFESWRLVNDPSTAEIPIEEYALLDSDSNGVSNLEEYVNGSDPLTAESDDSGQFELGLVVESSKRMFSLRQGRQRPDIVIDIESSSNLEDWAPITEELVLTGSTINPDQSWVRYFDQPIQQDSAPRATFFRVSARFQDLTTLLGGEPSLLSEDGTVYPVISAGASSWKAGAEAGDGFYSDGIAAGQSSSLALSVVGPGRVSFDWRVDGDPDDRLQVLVNSVESAVISGGTEWESVEIEIPSGDHLIVWEYSEGGSSGNGSGQVRRFLFTND